MARRSILTSARDEKFEEPQSPASEVAAKPKTKPGRLAKLHIGGYYGPNDPLIVSFQKLGIDLRKTQQEMLLDAIRDYVAKQEAAKAFG